jgi:hypothetical protein
VATRFVDVNDLDWFAGGPCSAGDGLCVATALSDAMIEKEQAWRMRYADGPDFGGREAPCEIPWPASGWSDINTSGISPDRLAMVDRTTRMFMDWSPRAGSSAAVAAFLMHMGYNSTSAVVRQARKVCRKLAFIGSGGSVDGLCSRADGEPLDWIGVFDFTTREAHCAHNFRQLLQHFRALEPTACDIDDAVISVAGPMRRVKVVRDPYLRALSSYALTMRRVSAEGARADDVAVAADASFVEYLAALRAVHRSPLELGGIPASGLHRLAGWGGHHRPQKRPYEFGRPAVFDRVIKIEAVRDTGHWRSLLRAIEADGPLIPLLPGLGAEPAVEAPCPSLEMRRGDLGARNSAPRTCAEVPAGSLARVGWHQLLRRFPRGLPAAAAFFNPEAAGAVRDMYACDFAAYGYPLAPPS